MPTNRGSVTVTNMNLSQGEFPEIENKLLYLGVGANPDNRGKVISLSNESNFDELFGVSASPLKTNLTAARLNAGQNWFAWALMLPDMALNDEYIAEATKAMDNYFTGTSPEGVVCLRPAQSEDEIRDWHDWIMLQLGQCGRQMFATVATSGILETQTWSDYEAAQMDLVANVAANRVMVVPQLHGNDAGVVTGRLCNRSESIGDSPMKVETGALLGLGDTPVDADGVELGEGTLATLSAARFSTIQHYCDYPGTYWADGAMLDVPAGDYQVIEYLRPVLKACRAVRILAIARIADRKFNETPESIAYHKSYFARPLREMSKSTTIDVGGQQLVMVGDIMKPGKDAVTITWITKRKVQIYIKVKPYSSPKDIEANVYLDLSLEDQ